MIHINNSHRKQVGGYTSPGDGGDRFTKKNTKEFYG